MAEDRRHKKARGYICPRLFVFFLLIMEGLTVALNAQNSH